VSAAGQQTHTLLNRHARVIADLLTKAGQTIEELDFPELGGPIRATVRTSRFGFSGTSPRLANKGSVGVSQPHRLLRIGVMASHPMAKAILAEP